MSNNVITLKELAYSAIAKHTRKIVKYETGVIQAKNPEDLHQMRVEMRRLRSAIAIFDVALDLPTVVNEKNLAKIGRSLGKLRDLDVLLATLGNDYRPLLPQEEQKSLDKAIKSLGKQRKKELKQVRQTLKSKLYFNLLQALNHWLEKPQYKPIAELSIYSVLPDLLFPQISQLLLHSGWLVGVELEADTIQSSEMLNQQAVEKLLTEKELVLHDLRKIAKKTRYNLEKFSQFHDDIYGYYMKQIEQIQEVLGHIQDGYVLQEILEKILESTIVRKMPKLTKLLREKRYQKWQEWELLQEEFLDEKSKKEFRQTIITTNNIS